MKMIRSTNRMSIIGTTLGSDVSAPRASPPPPAMLVLLLLFLGGEQGALRWLRNGCHHPHASLPRGLDRLLDFGILQLVVRLEVENLVLGSRSEARPKLVFERAARERSAVEKIVA